MTFIAMLAALFAVAALMCGLSLHRMETTQARHEIHFMLLALAFWFNSVMVSVLLSSILIKTLLVG